MSYKVQIRNYIPTCSQERSDKEAILQFVRNHPHNVLKRDNTVAHMTASGFIMDASLEKVLFIFHKVYQSWGWTGGHTDGDRDLLEVALKEAREETGLYHLTPLTDKALSLDILPVWGHTKRGKYVSAHLHLNLTYVLIADPEDPLVVNEVETDGVQWIAVDEMKKYVSEPDLLVVYEKLVKAARRLSQAANADHSNTVDSGTLMGNRQRSKPDFGDAHGKSLKSKITEAAIPIAVHEAKSAYYKLKLVKELGQGITEAAQKRLRKPKN